MTPSDEIVDALNKLHDTFNGFNHRIAGRSRKIELLKEKIGFEEKMLKMRVMQKELLTRKHNAILGLTELLGSEMRHVEGLQRKIVNQHESLTGLSEHVRKMEQDHTMAMVERRFKMEKFAREYNRRLQSAANQMWGENQQRIMDVKMQRKYWEEKLNGLRGEVQKRKMEYTMEERQLEQDLLEKEREVEDLGLQKIQNLEKCKRTMKKKFETELKKMRVQAEGQVNRLREEYDELCRRLNGALGGHSRPDVLLKGSKRKYYKHPYLQDFEEGK